MEELDASTVQSDTFPMLVVDLYTDKVRIGGSAMPLPSPPRMAGD